MSGHKLPTQTQLLRDLGFIHVIENITETYISVMLRSDALKQAQMSEPYF